MASSSGHNFARKKNGIIGHYGLEFNCYLRIFIMKLQISFNLLDLKEALAIAKKVHEYCDAFEIGSLMITQYGMDAVVKFRKNFPEKTLICDTKIIEYEKEMVQLAAKAGSDWINVLASNNNNVIHNACNAAHNLGKKIILDLVSASSFGQMAVEAKSLGADAILFHTLPDENQTFLDRWDMVKGNTDLPVFISTCINRNNVHEIIKAEPAGIVIGYAITRAKNPAEEAQYFYNLIENK
jgi:3-hexulose-6-phosphate synthase